WTMDTLQGFGADPLDSHNYLYAHSNPVNRVDPSGNFDLPSLAVGVSARLYIGAATFQVTYGVLAETAALVTAWELYRNAQTVATGIDQESGEVATAATYLYIIADYLPAGKLIRK